MIKRVLIIIGILICISLSGTRIHATELYSDGRLDVNFARGRALGADFSIKTVYVLSTGKILVGGENWSSFNGEDRGGLVRLNSDGTFDETFNEGGSGARRNSSWNSLLAVKEQSDGKIIIGGSFTTYNGLSRNRIARLNSDGSLDTTFNPGIGANNTIYSLALQSDGKMIIGGNFTTYNGVSRNRIARLNSDGSLDTTFNPGTGTNNYIYSIVLQSDGKIIIGGYFTTYTGISRNRIARLNIDGGLDITFDPGIGASGEVTSILFESNGKIIIGGNFTTYNGVSRNRIARLNTDGSLDTTFNPGTGTNTKINSIVLQSDGKIIIGGYFTSYNGVTRNKIARVNNDGSLDSSFNNDIGPNGSIFLIAFQLNEKLLICGFLTQFNGIQVDRIARLNDDGTLDIGFNMVEGSGGPNTKIKTLGIQDDGKIIISGGCDFKYYDGVYVGGIARINPDGSLDTSFNNQGTGPNYDIYDILQQDDGKIIIGGGFTTYKGVSRNGIARLNSDGGLDITFDPGTGVVGTVFSTALQSDGKIIIGGSFTTYNGVSRNMIARLNSDGTLDMTFDPGVGANNRVYTFVLQNDGKIIIGGHFTSYNGIAINRIARLNTDGSLDTTFNPGTGVNNSPNSVALQNSGKILIFGRFTSFNGVSINSIARLNEDGSLDNTFNQGGSGFSASTTIEGIVQEDYKILFTYPGMSCNPLYNGEEVKRLNRLNSDGTIDSSFNVGGSGPNSKVKDVKVADDGGIYLVGRFQSYNDTKVAYLAKLGLPDVEAPTGSISINSGAVYTTNTNVTLTLNAIDSYSGLKEMMVCSNSSFEGCGWESYTGSKPWVFDSNLGTKTLYVKYKDNEDNVSEVYSDSIELYNLVVRITDIGLIDDVPDRESLYYYFTSQRVVIQGETKSNSTVYFTYDNETYTTTSDLQGKYSITLWVDMGTNSISYYAEDESGNESPTRTLTLIVGTEYFPDWLLIKLGILPEIDEEEEVIEEEIVEEEEEEEDIVIPEIEEETNTPIQIIGFDGDPLRDSEVVFDGISYITDGEGYIYVIDVEEGSHIVKLKINEEEYSQLLVLGEDDLKGGSIVKFEYKADYTMYFIVGCLSLIIMTSVFMIIYKRRRREDR